METRHAYRYVGPADLGSHARPGPQVVIVTSPGVLAGWLAGRSRDELAEPFTFIVALDGLLRLAPRRSEHVDCAAGQDVLAAGEVLFAVAGGQWQVSEISNQSAGYCPDPDSWPAVARALDRAAIAHPGDFTHKFVFRRCPACAQVNIVRDGNFACALCDGALPAQWNISQPAASGPDHPVR
jgi:hypothetical protein